MATAQVHLPSTAFPITFRELEVLSVSGGTDAFIILDGSSGVIRIKLTPKEAQAIAAKLAPHIP